MVQGGGGKRIADEKVIVHPVRAPAQTGRAWVESSVKNSGSDRKWRRDKEQEKNPSTHGLYCRMGDRKLRRAGTLLEAPPIEEKKKKVPTRGATRRTPSMTAIPCRKKTASTQGIHQWKKSFH